MSKRGPGTDRFLAAVKLSKTYRQGGKPLQVLKSISLHVGAGEYLTIVGPSGAGKSTLLHVLGLLDRPSDGEVWFEGRNLSRLSGAKQAQLRNRYFGFVFQFFHLLPDFNAIENVLMPAMVGNGVLQWPGRRRAARRRAEELLDRVGLKERMRHRPTQLSGGECQRVAICRALINDPPVLLLDEPTGNLDSKTGAQILELVQELNVAEKQTVVMVTHDVHAAEAAGRVIHLHDGEIVKQP